MCIRDRSTMVYTKVVTNKSPWLRKAVLDQVYAIPASHGEGRFVASQEWIEKLFKNGQVATQYVNLKMCIRDRGIIQHWILIWQARSILSCVAKQTLLKRAAPLYLSLIHI